MDRNIVTGNGTAAGPTGRQAGFTMVELLVVTTILMILAGLGLVQYRNSVTRAKEAVLKEDLFRMRDAIDQFYADRAQYPSSLDELVSAGYLRALPVDPFTQSKTTWVTVNAEASVTAAGAAAAAEQGVYDVKSGSDATSLDGTPYADWN
jgi:general secretion pathway protein G